MHPIIAETLVRNYQSSRIRYAQERQLARKATPARRVDKEPRRRLRLARLDTRPSPLRSSGVRNRRYRLG